MKLAIKKSVFNQTRIDIISSSFSLPLSFFPSPPPSVHLQSIGSSMHSPDIVYAIHNFEAENEDEVTFRYGEPIVILEKDDQFLDGWWQVRCVYLQVEPVPNITTK